MSEGSDMAHWDIKKELCSVEGGQSALMGGQFLTLTPKLRGT